MKRAARLFLYATALAWLALAVMLIAGCGGGDPEPDTPPPGVDCVAQPERCK
jgi:hypothetical protein